MMIITQRTVPLLLFFCLAFNEAVAESLTLHDSVALALAQNPQLKAYSLGVGEAREDVYGAWGDFLPTLSLGYSRNQLTNNAPVEWNTDYLDQKSNSTTISLNQSLFSSFSGVAGVKRANMGLKSQEYRLNYVQAQVIKEIRQDFYAVLHAQALLELWETAIGRLRRQKEVANAWYERQLATRLRLLEVEVELSAAIQQRDVARSRLTTARARMAHWLALPSPDELVLDGSLEEDGEAAFPSLSECLEIARRERPDLKMADLNISMAEQEKIQVAAQNLPKASLVGSWTDYSNDYETSRYPDEQRDYYSVTLQLSIQPFQGGKNIAAWRRQGLTIEKMQQQQLDTDKTIETEVRTAYSQWQDSETRINASVDTLRQATEAWQIANRALELGAGSLRDLLDAELRRTRAEITWLDALQYRQQTRTDLAYAIGGYPQYQYLTAKSLPKKTRKILYNLVNP
jgi:outer membrane protein TolC